MDSSYPDDVLEGDHYEETSVYPDIEDDPDSAWHNEQSFDVGNMLASVIDPRLFNDQPTQHPKSINQYPAGFNVEETADAGYPSNDEYEDEEYPIASYPPVPGEVDESDEDFVMSDEDESARYVCCESNILSKQLTKIQARMTKTSQQKMKMTTAQVLADGAVEVVVVASREGMVLVGKKESNEDLVSL